MENKYKLSCHKLISIIVAITIIMTNISYAEPKPKNLLTYDNKTSNNNLRVKSLFNAGDKSLINRLALAGIKDTIKRLLINLAQKRRELKEQPEKEQKYVGRKIGIAVLGLLSFYSFFTLLVSTFFPDIPSKIAFIKATSPFASALGILGPASFAFALYASIKNSKLALQSAKNAENLQNRIDTLKLEIEQLRAIIVLANKIIGGARKTGLEEHYRDRYDAFFGTDTSPDGFFKYMDKEIAKGREGKIRILGTSLSLFNKRSKSGPDKTQGAINKKEKLAYELKARIEQAIKEGCDFQIILAYPEETVTEKRQGVEDKKPGSILRDTELTVKILQELGVSPDNIRFHTKMPTAFVVITLEAMLVNPYTSIGSSTEQPCDVYINNGPGSIYGNYQFNYFDGIWDKPGFTISYREFRDSGEAIFRNAETAISSYGIINIKNRARVVLNILPEGVLYGMLIRTLQAIIKLNPSELSGDKNLERIKKLKDLLNNQEQLFIDLVFQTKPYSNPIRIAPSHRESASGL